MKAVNLIPADQRRGAGGVAGRSGGIVYVVAGGLVVVVVLGVIYALAVKDVADRTGQLNQATAEVGLVQNQTNALQNYLQVHDLAQSKVGAVAAIAQSRFNWPGAMAQLALALPSDVTFTSLTAVAANSASSATSAVPSTTTPSVGPSFSLAGCASSQSEIATIISRLQSVPAVTNVALSDSAKQTDKAPNSRNGTVSRNSAASSSGRCSLVSWTISLSYSGGYTVPNQRLRHSTSASKTSVSANASQNAQVAR